MIKHISLLKSKACIHMAGKCRQGKTFQMKVKEKQRKKRDVERNKCEEKRKERMNERTKGS